MTTRAAPIRWYHDFISPFAYLHWPRVRALMEHERVELVPVLLGPILDAAGQKGPAEIPGKRVFTYRDVVWRARRAGVPLRFPGAHPFNSLGALRLLLAAGNTVEATTRIYDWIWADGRRRRSCGTGASARSPGVALTRCPTCGQVFLRTYRIRDRGRLFGCPARVGMRCSGLVLTTSRSRWIGSGAAQDMTACSGCAAGLHPAR